MPRKSRLGRRALTVTAAASLLGSVVAAGASVPAGAAPTPAPASSSGNHRATALHNRMGAQSPAYRRLALGKMKGLEHAHGQQTVFVRFRGSGAAATASGAARRATGSKSDQSTAAKSAALARRASVAGTADSVMQAARVKDAKITKLYVVSNAVPGIALRANAKALEVLAARPDVVKISQIVPKKLSNASAAQLTRVLDTWQSTHNFGRGVKVGIIDTGLDYTHADFGGVGTRAAYQRALANDTSPAWYNQLPVRAKAKIVGGIDFVGDSYNADPASPDYQPVPHPDPNPLDCNEHGTHVAGTASGYGVAASGATFTGDYSTLTSTRLYNLKIGPGMAPQSRLYPLRVFGCDGSTDVVIEALDRSLDPNGDGDFSDKLDIVNLSLGSDFGAADDPENAVVDALAAQGVVPVIAMGNAGDLTDAGGTPGNAVRSIAVASTVDEYQLRDGLQVNAPPSVAGIVDGQNSVFYDYAASGDVLNSPVVTIPGDNGDPSVNNNDGCDPFDAAARAAVAGKTVWLEWDDNDATRRCGSVTRTANAVAAGAVGTIFTSTLNVFGGGIFGDTRIPTFQLPKTQTDRLRPAAQAGTLNVSFKGELRNTIKSRTPSITDTISSFTSRGPHGSIGVVKPDVAAPGDTIASAGMGTGNDVLVISGTSMATPHTAGIAALVKSVHPGWSTEQIKAAIMNTANHDLYTGPSRTGHKYGPARVGAGRVDALGAVSTKVLAYDSNTAGAVSESFGVVEAPVTSATVTRRKAMTLENTGTSAVRLTLAYEPIITQPGVSYSVSPALITVAAGARATAFVTMRITPQALRHTIDPTMETDQLGVPRQYVSDASGHVLVTQFAAPALRVPVYGAAKPVSLMQASAGSADGVTGIKLSGSGFSQGSGPTGWSSLASAMDLGAVSTRLPKCPALLGTNCTQNRSAEGADLQYVGTGSFPGQATDGTASLANGFLYFGISTWGNNANIGQIFTSIPVVDFDTNGDGNVDFEVFAEPVPGSDVLVAALYSFEQGAVIDLEPINFEFGDVDTNVFDSNTLIMPVALGAIGVTDATTSFPVTYQAYELSAYTSNPNLVQDITDPITTDAVRPAVDLSVPAGSVPLYDDRAGEVIPALVKRANTKALVFHLHNTSGTRAQVVTLQPFAKSSLVEGVTRNLHPGDTAKIGSTLTDALTGEPISGATVRLQRRYYPNGAVQYPVGTFTTNSVGKAFASIAPKRSFAYSWVYDGSGTHAAAKSGEQLVLVQ